MSPACHEASPRVSASVSLPTTALATVLSSASRILATPRAISMRVCSGVLGCRSFRAGMRLRIAPDVGASWVVVIARLRAGLFCCVPAAFLPVPLPAQSRSPGPVGRTPRCIVCPGRGHADHMQLPEPRPPLTTALSADLPNGTSLSPATLAQAEHTASHSNRAPSDPLTDDDLQLSLAACYELHYRGFDGVAESWEWDPDLLRLRALLEHAHTAALRPQVAPLEAFVVVFVW